MALTPTEEAQTRQLLDQLASLLSLASSEPTIISKLAATKVSLSDLASVVTVNDTDLLLSRQGTDDKAVTVQKIKDHVKDSVSTVAFNDGTAAAPSITNNGDLDTGAYFPDANVFAVTTGGTERIRFTNTGIGVNVATPTKAVEIAGSIASTDDNGFQFQDLADSTKGIIVGRTGVTHNYVGISGAVGRFYSSTSLALVADTVGGNNSILFSVGGALRATMQWDGKFGIGTASPATTLDVNGDVTITDKIIHSGDTDTAIRFPAVDTVAVETGGAERLRVTSTGNVGIGTSSPAARFHAAGSYTAPTGGIDAGVQGILSNTAGFAGLQILSENASSAYIHLGDTDDADRGAIIYDHATDQLQFNVSAAQRARITSTGLTVGSAELTTPSGSAPLYAARAWVNFNGTGTVAIRASGNVTSITDNNTGDYTVNFTTAMPDANYSTVTASQWSSGAATNTTLSVSATNPPTSSAVRLINFTGNAGALADLTFANVAIFR
jgi:hypothetical protein